MLQIHKDCIVQLSFEIIFLLKHIILPHYSLARLSHWRKYCLAHDRLKISWTILSPFFVLRKFRIKGVADGCRLQKGCGKTAKLGYSWLSVSTCGSRMVAFGLKIHFDTHWPGEDDYRPASFFQTVWLNQNFWYPKNGKKDVWCRRDVKGWLSQARRCAKLGYSWPSVSTCGSRMVALGLKIYQNTFWPALTWGRWL